MTVVCTGSEFDVDAQGRLKIALALDPPDVVMPAGASQYLKRDPVKGLWVEPTYVARVRVITPLTNPDILMAPGDERTSVLSVVLTNPSKTRTSYALLTHTSHVQVRVEAGGAVGLSTARGTGSAAPTVYTNAESVHNGGSAVQQSYKRLQQTWTVVLPPNADGSTDGQVRVWYGVRLGATGATGANTRYSTIDHALEGVIVSA